jgi:NAD+ kinase
MKIALVVHSQRPNAIATASELIALASARGFAVSVGSDDAELLPGTTVHSDEPTTADVIVAVGGDGTMLEAVRMGLAADLPVLGVNAGHIGFLTQVEPALMGAALDALGTGAFSESRRMTLTASLPGMPPATGINDVVIEKAPDQNMAKITLWVGEERLVSYRADAVVVASPTGSTAYTFSAGGPLVDPELEALVITPVAPHNLFGRPIVFGPEIVLRVAVDEDRTTRVKVDGRTFGDLAPGGFVEVERGDTRARLVQLAPRNFAAAVRDKFHLHDA